MSLTGARLHHYEIVGALGAGGMGDVYRAKDTKLGRTVALKVISPAMASHADRLDRFRREAKALAAIDHPNIVTVFSVEEADGIHFLTMQLVEGEPLDRVIPDGGMAADRIVAIGSGIAEALAAAHDKGIVHRDLKPANVMVSHDGRVKVLDFGLAKEISRSDPEDATLTSAGRTQGGVVLGTPAYMSPEQVAGRPVNHRTDIFSLGVLLYQMATGRRPFDGASAAELASAILRDTPPPISELRTDAPSGLAHLIRRCLEKDVARRVQTARDIGNELRDIAGASITPPAVESADAGFWVAVLPFTRRGAHADLDALADGLTEEILTGLSRFSYLRVIARSSTSRYADTAADIRTVGRELGARYVMEGSVRQAGSQLRVAARLVDAKTGAHLWAETYNRPFAGEAIFDVQDELVPRIVSSVADWYGALPHSMSDALGSKPVEQLSPYEAVLRSFRYTERRTADEHAAARAGLERAVQQAPGYADAWALLSIIYSEDYSSGFNLVPDPLGRALEAARRATNADSSSALAHFALARASFFRKEFPTCRTAAERAMALNPMDGGTSAFIGVLLAYSGDWEHGCALVERAMQLNPRHPGWYWFPLFLNAYRTHDYHRALSIALKINLPRFYYTHVMLGAVYGQLGEREPAAAALSELLALRPDFAASGRDDLGRWYEAVDLVDHLMDGLRKAGLRIPDAATTGATPRGRVTDGHASPGPSIAVLPFANMSADHDDDYFSDGLAEEIINLLARVSGLKVIARTSAFAFRGKEQDIRGIADALGVRTILQGSVRRAGTRVRVTVQLIDAADGSHRWSERYDRELTDVFAIQDDIGRAVSGALQVRLAPRAQAVNIEAYQCYLKGRHSLLRLTPDGIANAKEYFEQALSIDPDYAAANSGLAEHCHAQLILGLQPVADLAPRLRLAADRALALDPAQSEAHSILASVAASADYQWDVADGHHRKAVAAEGALSQARFRYAAWYLLPLGRVAEAAEQIRLGLETDPLSMSMHYGLTLGKFVARQHAEAIDCARKALEIDATFFPIWLTMGHAQLQLGSMADAITSLSRVVELAPWMHIGIGSLAAAYHASGDRERSAEWVRRLTADHARSYGTAIYDAVAGDEDAMFDALDGAWQQRDVFLLFVQAMPFFDRYRADARFQRLLAKMNLAGPS